MNDLKYWVAFNRIQGIGRAKVLAMEEHFGNLEEAWRADAGELKKAGLDKRSVGNIVSQRPKIDPDAEMEALQKHRI
ncbi:MAG: DNA-protecting protein DprA, partial [Dehalococcoidia bacterium]